MDTRPAQIGTTGSTQKLSVTEQLDNHLQRGLDWVLENSTTVLAVLVGALVIGGIAAGIFEWVQSRRAAAFDELAKVQTALDKALPLEAAGLGGTETANPEIAKKAREDAVTGFDTVMKAHAGSLAGTAAGLAAARLEIALGQLDAADRRLTELASDAGDDVSRAAVLRLRGYVLEETGHADQAADLYAQIGSIEDYPGRVQAYVQAAETYERIGKIAPAIQALEALTLIAPEYAEQADILPQLETLRTRLARESGGQPGDAGPAAN